MPTVRNISAGDTLMYTITATNSGGANLTDVVVTDDLIIPTGGTTPCALVLLGGTCTLVGTYVVTPADVVAGLSPIRDRGFRSGRSGDRRRDHVGVSAGVVGGEAGASVVDGCRRLRGHLGG